MGFIDLTAINTYKRETHRNYCSEKNMAEKIHSTVLLSLCQNLFTSFKTREGNTEQVT